MAEQPLAFFKYFLIPIMPFTLDNLTEEIRLSTLSIDDLKSLADDIRREIIETVARQGGHLASNLGNLELVLALHTVFDFKKDRLFFDTGHQCYVHKLLTGRRKAFAHLRESDGCCGFPLRSESEYDFFGAGHSGTAISAALGFAAARDLNGDDCKVMALVGDGAIGCGSSLEGLNNVDSTTKDFICILNDNKMSIAPNVGAISKFLNHIISGRKYNIIKSFSADFVNRIPCIGKPVRKVLSRIELAVKSMLMHGTMFEDLGFRYIGPIDGNDLESLISILGRIRELKGPIFLHVLTQKGNGYAPAVQNATRFHGTPPFEIATGLPKKTSSNVTFSSAFGETLCSLRGKNPNIVALTAGMRDGTGLGNFSQNYPDSFFDVGIAEGHATAFAAGLAAAGKLPFFAVYASFSQRAFDYVFHDVCLQNLPVVFCLDRAGIVVDGPTHHGIQDFAFWRAMPNLTVMQPSDAEELSQMMEMSLALHSPVVIRYPSGNAEPLLNTHTSLKFGRAELVRQGTSPVAIWTVGRELETGLAVEQLLFKEGISPTLVNTRFTLPFDVELMKTQAASGWKIYIIENHSVEGGFGSLANDVLSACSSHAEKIGWPGDVIGWGSINALRQHHGLNPDCIAKKILADIQKR